MHIYVYVNIDALSFSCWFPTQRARVREGRGMEWRDERGVQQCIIASNVLLWVSSAYTNLAYSMIGRADDEEG